MALNVNASALPAAALQDPPEFPRVMMAWVPVIVGALREQFSVTNSLFKVVTEPAPIVNPVGKFTFNVAPEVMAVVGVKPIVHAVFVACAVVGEPENVTPETAVPAVITTAEAGGVAEASSLVVTAKPEAG